MYTDDEDYDFWFYQSWKFREPPTQKDRETARAIIEKIEYELEQVYVQKNFPKERTYRFEDRLQLLSKNNVIQNREKLKALQKSRNALSHTTWTPMDGALGTGDHGVRDGSIQDVAMPRVRSAEQKSTEFPPARSVGACSLSGGNCINSGEA